MHSAANVKRGFTSADPQTTAAVANAAYALRESIVRFVARVLRVRCHFGRIIHGDAE